VLRLEDIERPAVEDDSVLVRVRAAALNALDWHFMRGAPLLTRMGEGLRTPKTRGLGVDVAGEVEAVGKDVTELRPEDAVFGRAFGAFAEFARGKPRTFVPKPANISFEQAAANAVAGCTALQGLRDRGQLTERHRGGDALPGRGPRPGQGRHHRLTRDLRTTFTTAPHGRSNLKPQENEQGVTT
jgi:NADPH:quinone reductase-like Zn-dependent oxidoreductase